MIDPYSFRREPAPRKAAPNKTEMYCTRICPQCGQGYRCRLDNARTCEATQAPCKRCSNLAKSHLAANYCFAKPSASERVVMAYLDNLAIPYEFQYVFGRWILDFVIGEKAIEVNGYWHRRNQLARDAQLAKAWTGPILFLDDTAPDFTDQLTAFVMGGR